MTLSYYSCNFFNKSNYKLNNFLVEQEELLLKEVKENNSIFEKQQINYSCCFIKHENFDNFKPTAILCVRDSSKLLTFTLNNLKNNKAFNYVNFIIVDDRSEENIKEICKNYPVSYLRVDNQKGFNFSMLNNIAAKICYDNGVKQIILWNSDLFLPDDQQLPKLIELHLKKDATISGTKLVYPTFKWNEEEIISHNMESNFPNKLNTYRGSIQFGGSVFAFINQFQTYFPDHFCRFKKPDYYLACENKLDKFVTGAFQIIDLQWFIDSGGLNPSMALNFQDVDLCLKAYKNNKKVYYFGEDNYLFHDESVTISKSKKSSQFLSDHILYSKLWTQQEFIKSILKYEA